MAHDVDNGRTDRADRRRGSRRYPASEMTYGGPRRLLFSVAFRSRPRGLYPADTCSIFRHRSRPRIPSGAARRDARLVLFGYLAPCRYKLRIIRSPRADTAARAHGMRVLAARLLARSSSCRLLPARCLIRLALFLTGSPFTTTRSSLSSLISEASSRGEARLETDPRERRITSIRVRGVRARGRKMDLPGNSILRTSSWIYPGTFG